VQVEQRCLQALVAGRCLDSLMEAVVRLRPGLELAARDRGPAPPTVDEIVERPAEELDRRAEPVELVVGDQAGGELGREPLQLGANDVRLANLADGRAPDDGAAIGSELDQPSGLELAERL